MVDKKSNQDLQDTVKLFKGKKYKHITKEHLTQKLREKKELIKKLKDKLLETKKIAQEKEILSKEYLEHLKRLHADFENYKKRQEKKKKEFIEFANERLLNNLLSIVDNLERALESTENDNDIEAIRQGINNILIEFYNVLNKEGVRPIKTIGHKFDPYKHEAVMSFKTDQYPEDMVTEELRKGYYIKSKVLRPAMVKVTVSIKGNKI